MKPTPINLSRRVAVGYRSARLQILGNQLIDPRTLGILTRNVTVFLYYTSGRLFFPVRVTYPALNRNQRIFMYWSPPPPSNQQTPTQVHIMVSSGSYHSVVKGHHVYKDVLVPQAGNRATNMLITSKAAVSSSVTDLKQLHSFCGSFASMVTTSFGGSRLCHAPRHLVETLLLLYIILSTFPAFIRAQLLIEKYMVLTI